MVLLSKKRLLTQNAWDILDRVFFFLYVMKVKISSIFGDVDCMEKHELV